MNGKKKERKTYSKEEKEEVVKAVKGGESMNAVSKRTGININTVSKWCNPDKDKGKGKGTGKGKGKAESAIEEEIKALEKELHGIEEKRNRLDKLKKMLAVT